MTYIGSFDGHRIGVSTKDFGEHHRDALLKIAEGEQLRTVEAYQLEDMGLARIARTADYGASLLTRRGEAMLAYLRENGEAWR